MLIEYGIRGIPVAASDFGPYSDYVQDGVTGFLCKTPKDWTEALVTSSRTRTCAGAWASPLRPRRGAALSRRLARVRGGVYTLMTVNMEDLKEGSTAWSSPSGRSGPTRSAAPRSGTPTEPGLAIDVPHAVWTCDDEQDGCPRGTVTRWPWPSSWSTPGYALGLIQAVKRLQREVQDLERDLEGDQ